MSPFSTAIQAAQAHGVELCLLAPEQPTSPPPVVITGWFWDRVMERESELSIALWELSQAGWVIREPLDTSEVAR